jgi:hypothetical protein
MKNRGKHAHHHHHQPHHRQSNHKSPLQFLIKLVAMVAAQVVLRGVGQDKERV